MKEDDEVVYKINSSEAFIYEESEYPNLHYSTYTNYNEGATITYAYDNDDVMYIKEWKVLDDRKED